MFPDTWIVKRQIEMPVAESNWGWQKRPTVTIYPIGDLHLGAIGCNEREWSQFVQFIQNEPDSYVAVIGDMIDNATKDSIASNYATDVMYSPSKSKELLAEYLKPIAHKVVGAVKGNHEARSRGCDYDILYDVFCRLGIEDVYRAGTAFVYLQIGERTVNSKQRSMQSYKMILSHGVGNGRMIGSGVNRQYQFGIATDCDVLITGHTHQPTVARPSRVVFDPMRKEIRTEPFICVQCASWLSYTGYPLQKMLPPTSTWDNDYPQKIELCGARDKKMVRATM